MAYISFYWVWRYVTGKSTRIKNKEKVVSDGGNEWLNILTVKLRKMQSEKRI